MFVTILVYIEQHYWVHFEPLAVRIACFEDFRFEGLFEVTSLEEPDVLIKLIKKIIWQSGSGGWQMCIKTSGSSKVKANVILTLHALFLHQLCNAGPSLHLSTSFERQLLSSCQSNALCIYISLCLLRCETLACKCHYLSSPWLISQHCQMIEVRWRQPPMEDELRSAGNKCNTVIMRNGQQSSLDITLQSPHCVTSQFIFSELVGSSSFMWKALSVRGIVSGLAARI